MVIAVRGKLGFRQGSLGMIWGVAEREITRRKEYLGWRLNIYERNVCKIREERRVNERMKLGKMG